MLNLLEEYFNKAMFKAYLYRFFVEYRRGFLGMLILNTVIFFFTTFASGYVAIYNPLVAYALGILARELSLPSTVNSYILAFALVLIPLLAIFMASSQASQYITTYIKEDIFSSLLEVLSSLYSTKHILGSLLILSIIVSLLCVSTSLLCLTLLIVVLMVLYKLSPILLLNPICTMLMLLPLPILSSSLAVLTIILFLRVKTTLISSQLVSLTSSIPGLILIILGMIFPTSIEHLASAFSIIALTTVLLVWIIGLKISKRINLFI